LREETAKMRESGHAMPETATPQARATVELLAGMPFDSLWGNNNIGYLNRNKPAAPSLKDRAVLNSTYHRG
ncbi:MFS transporter, partial [Huaxiibacter chinensis]